MLFLPTKPVASPAAGTSILRINREDISFETLPGRVVLLSVTVHNDADEASEPTTMRVNAAPLGVFLPSREVAQVAVDRIPPRSKRVVQSAFAAPWQEGIPDQDREQESGLRRACIQLLQRMGVKTSTEELELLPSDALYSLAHSEIKKNAAATPQPSYCWAGNFEVHVIGASAERHIRGGIRLESGRLNHAEFEVGDGKTDRYQFKFLTDEQSVEWDLTLRRVEPGEWHQFEKKLVRLTIKPPKGATTGCVAVEVTRESTGKSAMVEFGFGADAHPSGSYVSALLG